jgi:hypothetical protein
MDELLRALNDRDVRYLVVGGQAMRLAGLPGIRSFDEAERAAVVRRNEQGTAVRCLSGPHLLAAKQAAGRPQDQVDIEFLLELQRLGKL